MASISVAESSPRVGLPLTVTGEGFTPAAVVSFRIDALGIFSEVVADSGGYVGVSEDEPNHATATLTSDATNVSADDTVVIDSVTYTFKATVTTLANAVKIGTDAAESLANLKAAINLESGAGTKYGSNTVVHPTVRCTGITATTLLLAAKTGGTAGNSMASTEGSTHLSFGGATFSGGSGTTGITQVQWTPEEEGTYELKLTDGTNTATTKVRVYT